MPSETLDSTMATRMEYSGSSTSWAIAPGEYDDDIPNIVRRTTFADGSVKIDPVDYLTDIERMQLGNQFRARDAWLSQQSLARHFMTRKDKV